MSVLQPDNSVNIGLQIGTIPSDELVSTYESYNPQYSSTVVKQGTNPIPPENSIVLSKEVDQVTGIVTIVCGVYPSGTPGQPQGDRAVEQVKTASAGVFAEAGRAAKTALRLETDQSGAISNLTYQTVSNVKPTSALDAARAQGLEAATIVGLLPGQGQIRGFSGGAPGLVNPQDAGVIKPSIAVDAPGMMDMMFGDISFWLLIVAILVGVLIAAVVANQKYRWFDLSRFGLGGDAGSASSST